MPPQTHLAPSVVVGSTEPRLWTPPLRPLTPDTSDGYAVIEFAHEILGITLDPWQQWLLIHGLELRPDGSYRFRNVLVLVGRQVGKSLCLAVLALFWHLIDEIPDIVMTSNKLQYAFEFLEKAEKLGKNAPALKGLLPKYWKRKPPGFAELRTENSVFTVAAANENGGRSKTIHRLIQDELMNHRDYKAWGAAIPAMGAVPNAQAWHLSSGGYETSIVLNEQRDAALSAIEAGDTAYRTALFEWSCDPADDPLDITALAKASPSLGIRKDAESLLGDAQAAVLAGGEALAKFRVEEMCVRVRMLDPAIDPAAWKTCLSPGSLDAYRDRVALCVDVSLDQQHATLCAAAVTPDGVRVEVVKAWYGVGCTKHLRAELPALVSTVKPRALGWFPTGPAAAVAADLEARKGNRLWPPHGVTVEEIRGDSSAVCMGFAALVTERQVLHADDALLDQHVLAAEKQARGEAWVFGRKDSGHVDACYAAAGAVHLARTLPTPIGKPRIIVAKAA